MKVNRIVSTFVLFIFLVFPVYSVKKQIIPDWIIDKETVYSYKDYISEIGTGKTEEAAKVDALKNIGLFFESNVVTQITSESELSVTDEEVLQSRKMISKSVINSNITLLGVEYSDSYFDRAKREYKIVAFINRKRTFDIFEPEIVAAKNKFHSYTDLAQESLDEENDTIEACCQYANASKIAEEYLTNLMFGKLLYKDGVKKYSQDEKLIASLDAMYSKCMSNTKIFIKIENDYNGTIKTVLTNEFKKAGFTVVAEKNKANFYAFAMVTDNMEKSISDGETIYSYYPEFSLDLNSMSKQKYSYQIKLGKYSAFDSNVAKKKACNGLAKKMEEELSEDMISAILKK